jgi:hypothetical protein
MFQQKCNYEGIFNLQSLLNKAQECDAIGDANSHYSCYINI